MLGMSQEALAKRLSLTFQQVQKYEKGVNAINATRLHQLSKVLDTPVAYFFEGLGSGSPGREERGNSTAAEDDSLPSDRETLELVKAFASIKDRRLRRCLAGLMREIAEAS
jgi:transcriptional regulator with XRE-family HTH domain